MGVTEPCAVIVLPDSAMRAMTEQHPALSVACARMQDKKQAAEEGMRHGQRTAPCAIRCAALPLAAICNLTAPCAMRREEVLLHLYVTRRGCYTLPMRGLVLVTAPRAL